MPAPVLTLDDYVESFERVRRIQDRVDLRTFLPPGDDALYVPVLRELVRIDLEFGWESNRPRALEDYRRDFPALFTDPESLQEVAFEEYRLRRQAGQAPAPQEYARRYGIRVDHWPGSDHDFSVHVSPTHAPPPADLVFGPSGDASIRVGPAPLPSGLAPEAAQLFRVLELTSPRSAGRLAEGWAVLPEAGEEFLGFELREELGRGAFGRVFLARQAALADRPVALKVAPDVGTESQALAQLQHTHIVPIYSVHRAGTLQAVCMPYRGPLTLADVLRNQHGHLERPRAGLDLLRALGTRRRPEGVPPSPGLANGVRRQLEALDYPSAVLWLGARLAEGLAHAHGRGILHRDIKPANILVADDGEPMLLDFNVAEDLEQVAAPAAMMGGTLPYMAPEQLAAFLGSVRVVDGRADVYSLGLVLYELLTGRFPFAPVRMPPGGVEGDGFDRLLATLLAERQAGAPSPLSLAPGLSPAIASIVQHCLEPDPEKRYPSADALREDVERHLSHQPLRYAPEPSWRERAGKWLRRHPRFPLHASLTVGALLLVLAGLLAWRAIGLQQADVARTTRLAFRQDYRHAQFLLARQPDHEGQRQEGQALARGGLERYGALEDARWWRKSVVRALPPEHARQVREQAGDLLLLMARHALETGRWDEALDLNVRAEECFDEVPALVWAQRAEVLPHLGRKDEVADLVRRAKEKERSRHDRLVEARDHNARARYREALPLLDRLVRDDPDDYEAQFLLGECCAGLGQDARAVAAYGACIALEPDFHGPYVNRGLAHQRLRLLGLARADFDKAAELKPDRAETYLDRALVRQGMKDYAGAVADLSLALDHGIPSTRVYFLRARVKARMKDKEGAKKDLDEGMKRRPTDALSWVARGVARMERQPRAALADFDEALKLDPRIRSALQNKAYVLAEKLDRQTDARRVLRRLLESHPDSVPALAGQAVVLARLHRRAEAHAHIDAALARSAHGEVYYQAACVWAQTSRKHPADAATALVYLRRAVDDRYGWNILEIDPDLAPLRADEGFRRLVQGVRLLRK